MVRIMTESIDLNVSKFIAELYMYASAKNYVHYTKFIHTHLNSLIQFDCCQWSLEYVDGEYQLLWQVGCNEQSCEKTFINSRYSSPGGQRRHLIELSRIAPSNCFTEDEQMCLDFLCEHLVQTFELCIYNSQEFAAVNERCLVVGITDRLTSTEVLIAKQLAQGFSAQIIAALKGCSVRTVEKHMKSIYGKVGIVNKEQLIAKLIRPEG